MSAKTQRQQQFEDICSQIGRINMTLLVVFIVLKLTHLTDWSWWWVFAPLWVTCLVVLVVGWGILVYGMWRMTSRVKRAVRR